MVAFNCKRHGFSAGKAGLGCTHILKNIANGVNAKCIQIRIRTLPDDITKEENQDNKKYYGFVAFCLTCFEDKKLSQRMKIKEDWDIIAQAIDDFELKFICPECLDDYVEKNKLN